jgi:tRNA1(Val) A37 N6-methylase TrmN6
MKPAWGTSFDRMSPERAEQVTDDAALGGRLRLLQPRRGHRFGHDAILLAAATPAQSGDHVVELGAGVGAAGLAIAARVPRIRLTLIEIDPALASLAARNIERNKFADRAFAVCLDVAASSGAFAAAGLPAGCTDGVVMNPPFYDPERTMQSPDAQRRMAHVGNRELLNAWVNIAHRLLRAGGGLTLIYRADALNDVRAALSPHFGGAVILPILPRQNAQAIRIIATAVKGSQEPARVLIGLQLNDADGKPTERAEAVLRHAAALNLNV